VDTVAEALDLAMTRFDPDPTKTYGVFSEDDVWLAPPTSVASLGPQPDLFVSEVIEIPIGDRANPDQFEVLAFPSTAIIASLYRRVSSPGPETRLSSRSGLVLELDANESLALLNRSEFPLFPVSSSSTTPVTIRGDGAPASVFVFDPLVKISALKAFISGRLNLPPLFHLMDSSGRENPDEVLLREAVTEFIWVDATAAFGATEPVQVVVPAPETRTSTGPRAVYRLKWEDSVTEIELGDDQTVEDAKQIYADKVNVRAEHVSLLCRGKVMRDAQVLSRQRISAGQEIVVCVRNVPQILLRSNQPSIGPPPDDFEEQVDRLAAVTGTDKLTCSRCLRFNRYNYDDALADLLDVK
jgi:hypothetical protein